MLPTCQEMRNVNPIVNYFLLVKPTVHLIFNQLNLIIRFHIKLSLNLIISVNGYYSNMHAQKLILNILVCFYLIF
jgi:hypothetical protein